MAPPTTKPPSATHLERNHILQEILDHIEDFGDGFNLVDYDALKRDVLIPVLQENFDPEVQIRGFLKAFRHTQTFQDAFTRIQSPVLKKQITTFIEGKSTEDVVAQHGFEVSSYPSAPVKHHFSLLEKLK